MSKIPPIKTPVTIPDLPKIFNIMEELTSYFPREYHELIAKAFINALLGKQKGIIALIQLPTGAGKTYLFRMLSLLTGERYCLIVPRVNLAKQTLKDYPDFGLCQGSTRIRPNARVVLFTIRTYLNMIKSNRIGFDTFPNVFIDECHLLSTANSQGAIIEGVKRFDGNIFGLSATPFTSQGEPLELYSDAIQLTPEKWRDINLFFKMGFLVPVVCKTVGTIDKKILNVGSSGEYTKDSTQEAINKAPIDVVASTLSYAIGQTLIIALDTTHADALTHDFNSGVKYFADGRRAKAIAIHTKTKDYYSKEIRFNNEGRKLTIDEMKIEDFKKGVFNILVSVGKIGTGTDIAEIETVGMARPRRSKSLIEQEWGRGVRLCPRINKTYCLFLDFYGSLELSERFPTIPWTPKMLDEAEQKRGSTCCPECDTDKMPYITTIEVNYEEMVQTTFKKCGDCGNETVQIKQVDAITCQKCFTTQLIKKVYSLDGWAICYCDHCNETIKINELTPKELIITFGNRDEALELIEKLAKERLTDFQYFLFNNNWTVFKQYADLEYLSAIVNYFGNFKGNYTDSKINQLINRIIIKKKEYEGDNSNLNIKLIDTFNSLGRVNYEFIKEVGLLVHERGIDNGIYHRLSANIRKWVNKGTSPDDTKKLMTNSKKYLSWYKKHVQKNM